MIRRFGLIALLMVVGVSGAVSRTAGFTAQRVSAQQSDPAVLFGLEVDARNAGDTAGATAFFSEDAVFVGASCFPVACIGRAAIGQEEAGATAIHLQVKILSSYVEGTSVTGRFEVSGDIFTAAGVQRIISLYTVVVRGDRIVLFTTLPDVTDDETARFVAAQQH